ncbi:MAG: 2-amino-4-hydroxy-6-hydroxymethyldihydropteridine diphosphokinase, partial [Muribaculaceae bacterium]|nr:2-amino-4-hydroxy-6-hydroxymethyldihydropteridine diphosphokinase [Muribaculaceae bacterium]
MKYYISIGSNSPNKHEMVENGIRLLKELFPDNFYASHKYETKCIGGYGDDYANAVVSFKSVLDSPTLCMRLKELEIEAGRVKDDRESVILDLDAVMADDSIIRPKDFEREYFQIGYNAINNRHGIDPKNLCINDFVYNLPDERIAIHPLADRDKCKLLVCDSNGNVTDDIFLNIDKYLDSDSVLIYNNT